MKSKYQLSAIARHIPSCEPCFNALKSGNLSMENFDIIKVCRSKLEAEVREAFLIKEHKPLLNVQQHASGASHTLRVFG